MMVKWTPAGDEVYTAERHNIYVMDNPKMAALPIGDSDKVLMVGERGQEYFSAGKLAWSSDAFGEADNDSRKCQYCGQWGDYRDPCRKCGGPII